MPKRLSLTFACGDYEIVRPLIDGKVEVDGVDHPKAPADDVDHVGRGDALGAHLVAVAHEDEMRRGLAGLLARADRQAADGIDLHPAVETCVEGLLQAQVRERLVVPDARSKAVRRRVAKAVAGLDRTSELEAMKWIEAVSEFDAQ